MLSLICSNFSNLLFSIYLIQFTMKAIVGNVANCSLLTSRNDFASYVQKIFSTTNFDTNLLAACKGEICSPTWGDGNADIFGIGVRYFNLPKWKSCWYWEQMIIGYFFESVLGLVFAVSFAIYKPIPSGNIQQAGSVFHKLIDKDCKTFFALSTQIACVIVPIRKDFGIMQMSSVASQ
jgi:hypothetical protein